MENLVEKFGPRLLHRLPSPVQEEFSKQLKSFEVQVNRKRLVAQTLPFHLSRLLEDRLYYSDLLAVYLYVVGGTWPQLTERKLDDPTSYGSLSDYVVKLAQYLGLNKVLIAGLLPDSLLVHKQMSFEQLFKEIGS